ncbi:hypothetical protein HYH02_010229 [Chlamydomonas schloesseri]|uniref:Sulfatase N-terminal domain-containing protein n=1 Tax=Chlamydomonas schloesseri TaxID=2026947 RepID=A0A835W5Z0_9CHLO|nr:hypothetical protein HYH02_010229 [Chlamydomonas schloesseri]|eukprot:KAG2440650.1 hypothetical protein HYH02_010229 [Chlamydomonas schloesseri]
MPALDKYVRRQGLELPQFVTSIASCCPSRTSLLTGRYCHNTNITSNSEARGSAVKFLNNDLDDDYLPVWLQDAGYNTFLVGKFLNSFKEQVARKRCPQGWTGISPLIQDVDTEDGGEEAPRAPTYMEDCNGVMTSYPGTFQEEVIRDKALSYIDEASGSPMPFFLLISTVAPHDARGKGSTYPQVLPQYKDLYPGLKAPRTANWGRPPPIAIGFAPSTPNRLNASDIDGRYRARLQSLRAVDDTIEAVVKRLACHGLLENTIFMFTSDNGFKLGNHNVPREKFTWYEEDVRVPFLMAGPGVPRGVYVPEVAAAMTDLTATIAHLAGASPRRVQLDGAPLPLDRIAAAYPSPNQPGALSMSAAAAAGVTIDSGVTAAPLSSLDCTGVEAVAGPVPSPRPMLSPRPSPRKGPSGRRRSAQAAGGGQKAGSYVAGGAVDLGMEFVAAVENNGTGGSVGTSGSTSRRSLMQTGGNNKFYYGQWSNIQLIEGWLDVTMAQLLGKDYRVLRACTPFQAFSAPTEPRSGGHTCYKYVVQCSPKNVRSLGAVRQLFDLGRDPVELQDKFTQYKAPYNGIFKRLCDRLDAVLTVMSYCSGATCRNPFIAIHPDGSVTNLEQAMDARFDDLYGGFKKLSFKRCALYYHPANEIADARLVPTQIREWVSS